MRRLLLLLLLASPIASGSVTLVQFTKGHGASTSTAATLSGVAAGDTIIAYIAGVSTATLSSVTDSSTQTVAAGITYVGTTIPGVGIYYVANTASGTHTITFNWSSTNTSELFLAEYSGLSTSAPFDVGSTISHGSTTAIASSSITPTNNGELLIFAIAQTGGGATYSAFNNSFAAQDSYNVTGGPSSTWASMIQATAASISGAATSSSSNSSSNVLAAFVPATGGSCTHQGYTAGGALSIPNGSSGSYVLRTGGLGTPDCSTINYWQPTLGNFGVN